MDLCVNRAREFKTAAPAAKKSVAIVPTGTAGLIAVEVQDTERCRCNFSQRA